MRRVVLLAMILAVAGSSLGSIPAVACESRLLVLSAFPGEIDMLIEAADIDETVAIDGRNFFVGSLEGNNVVLALTGIGLENAEKTTNDAIEQFDCGSGTAIAGIVFSGVAGGPNIGDVSVPRRWTADGDNWFAADAAMIAEAKAVSGSVELAREVPTGDFACVGHDPDLISTVTVEHEPQVWFDGDGKSGDPFGGRTFPCIPGGGDVFGCESCRHSSHQADAVRFVTGAAPFINPEFFFSYFQAPQPSPAYDAVDMETAAVAEVAAGQPTPIPFIAFRAASDGAGDPLMLPGFPFQFFYYRQLAADNAARLTLAFLGAWATH